MSNLSLMIPYNDRIMPQIGKLWYKQIRIDLEFGSVYDPVNDDWTLTHWGRVTHICVGKLTIIGSDNGLWPGRRQAIIRTNAGILLIRPLGTNFSEFLVKILIFSFKKMRLKVSSAKRRPFCLRLNELKETRNVNFDKMWIHLWKIQLRKVRLKILSAMSYDCHRVSNHQPLDCLFSTLFWLTSKKTSKVPITGPLWLESTGDQ